MLRARLWADAGGNPPSGGYPVNDFIYAIDWSQNLLPPFNLDPYVGPMSNPPLNHKLRRLFCFQHLNVERSEELEGILVSNSSHKAQFVSRSHLKWSLV